MKSTVLLLLTIILSACKCLAFGYLPIQVVGLIKQRVKRFFCVINGVLDVKIYLLPVLILFGLSLPFKLTAQSTERYDIYEIILKGKHADNPFVDVQLSAEFQFKNQVQYVEGFYDGDDTWKIRFMPDEVGQWKYVTKSNVNKFNNQRGTFTCTPNSANNHGPVRVRDTYHFGYADGTLFYPIGTTAYGWVHQPDNLKRQTLETLRKNSFNKIRMTVMPKQYGIYIQNEPPFYPYEGSKASGWDFSRFNVAFFQHFEKYVDSLRQINIEADIILFHPYDYGKWGFDKMSVPQNVMYLRYFVARMAAYRNVWWAMANEFDMLNKPDEEWEVYCKTVTTYDPSNHLVSMHNGKRWYNHSLPWITHVSVQSPYLQDIQEWRMLYNKPVINDEPVYEGNVPTDWGNLTPEELTNRFWICWTRGAYCSHGETYEHPENILWWSRGGQLYGKSPKRIAFLHQIMEESPAEGLVPFHNVWNKQTYLYKTNEFYLHYFGNNQQVAAILNLPKDVAFQVDVIDTWEMTITKVEGTFKGETRIPIPQKPYMAVRAVAINTN